MANLTITDELLIAATVAGPVLAVQAQKFVERATERRRRKLDIFFRLMATRATRLSAEHVQALNMLDLVFSGAKVLALFHWQSKAERSVIDAWNTLRDKFGEQVDASVPANVTAWNARCDDLFVELMYALSKALGYQFDRVQLRRGIYYPRLHGEVELAQHAVLQGAVKVLAGEQPMKMDVVGFPVTKEAAELQEKLQKRLLERLEGPVPVVIKADESRQ